MKRPPSGSPSPYSKRLRRDSSPRNGAPPTKSYTLRADPSENLNNGLSVFEDSRLKSLEIDLANYASSIKSAQARHLEERQSREDKLHSLFLEHSSASASDDQELKALQQLYAAANGRLVDHLKKAASSQNGTQASTGSAQVNGRHDNQDAVNERQHIGNASVRNGLGPSPVGVDERPAGASRSDSSRTTERPQAVEHYQPTQQATQFLNSNFVNLAEALARVNPPAVAHQNFPQSQVDPKPARSARALWEATHKANTRPVTPPGIKHKEPSAGEHGRLTPVDQDTKVELEEGEAGDELYDAYPDPNSTSNKNMPDPHDHIPRLCPIALSGRERCPHGPKCRLWKKCIVSGLITCCESQEM